MVYLLISGIVIFGFLDMAARRSYHDRLITKTRFRIFALRDELRLKVIEGEIEQDKWFDYMDTTLTKMIDLVPSLKLSKVLLIVIGYQNDPTIMKSASELSAFLETNPYYADLTHRYFNCVTGFLIKRSLTGRIIEWFFTQEREDEAVKIMATAPETSTFGEYCWS